MEILIPIVFLAVLGLISPRRWRRWLIYPGIAVVSLIGFALSPLMVALANWGLVFSLPPDSGEKVDAIVVLGRGEQLREQRVDVVDQLWRKQRSPYIFASGMLDAHEILGRLKDKGLSRQVMGGESCSQTTEENAHFTAVLLHPREVKKILLVTDAPHMLRSMLVFRRFGFTVIPHVVPSTAGLDNGQQLQLMGREYLALADYTFTGRFNTRSSEEMVRATEDVVQKLRNWKCQM